METIIEGKVSKLKEESKERRLTEGDVNTCTRGSLTVISLEIRGGGEAGRCKKKKWALGRRSRREIRSS